MVKRSIIDVLNAAVVEVEQLGPLTKWTLNKRNLIGRSPLHYAVSKSNLSLVQMFLRNNACVNAVDCEGNTALHTAAYGENGEIVSALLSAGANTSKKNVYGRTALEIATRRGNTEFLTAYEQHLKTKQDEPLDQRLATPIQR